MGAIEVAKRIPTLGYEIVSFVVRPKEFANKLKEGEETALSKAEVLGWPIALSVCLFGLYALVTGHSIQDFWERAQGYDKAQITTHETETVPASPTFVKLGFVLGVGIGIDTPMADRRGLNRPQPVILSAGPGQLLLDNVVPSKLPTKIASVLLINIYIYLFILSLYPAAKIWRGSFTFDTALWFMNFYFASMWTIFSITILLQVIILQDVLNIKAEEINKNFVNWPTHWTVLYLLSLFGFFFFVVVRPFWVGFRTLFALSRTKFLGSLVISWLLSYFLFPIAAIAVFLVIRLQSWLDLIL